MGINFNSRMTEASKNLATKKQIDSALDLGDKSREQIKKIQMFDLK